MPHRVWPRGPGEVDPNSSDTRLVPTVLCRAWNVRQTTQKETIVNSYQLTKYKKRRNNGALITRQERVKYALKTSLPEIFPLMLIRKQIWITCSHHQRVKTGTNKISHSRVSLLQPPTPIYPPRLPQLGKRWSPMTLPLRLLRKARLLSDRKHGPRSSRFFQWTSGTITRPTMNNHQVVSTTPSNGK